MLWRAGNSKTVIECLGNAKGLLPSCLMTSTLLGAPSKRAMLTAPRIWQAISPRGPQPKSKKTRQFRSEGALAVLLDDLDALGRPKQKGHVDRPQNMAGHIAQRTAAKIEEAAPVPIGRGSCRPA